MKLTSRARWVGLFLGIILLIGAAFVLWAVTGPRPMAEALGVLEDDTLVIMRHSRWLSFAPYGEEPQKGLILYPGGRIDVRAYAPAARAIASAGYLVVLVPMPLNLAVLAPERASDVMEAFPNVVTWAIGGHSLGGAMAARYAYRHPEMISGLVLWAAYPAENNDLSDRDFPVLSLYGTRDGLADIDKIDASRALLPDGAIMVAIEGGNHAGFGWYGPQRGDLEATISRESQQVQIAEATAAFLEAVTAR